MAEPELRKALIADDHQTYGEVIGAILRASLARDVIVAQAVAEAIQQLGNWTPDILVTDLRFGSGPGGLELIRAARNHRRFCVQNVPIVVA